jgi:hypothetical protein
VDRKDWLALGRTLAIIATLVGCTWWLGEQIDGTRVDISMQIYKLQHHME